MYEELSAELRIFETVCKHSNKPDIAFLARRAADAIEKLQKTLKRSKDFEAFWQKEAEEALRKYQVAIAKAPQWIPVTERLPFAESGNASETVMVTDGRSIALAEWFNFEEHEPYWSYTGLGDITHWMPLPRPPKEDT